MKMLTRDSDKEYLESLVHMLEENGIPANIQGTETARMITPKLVFEPSLWIYLNEQFEDAVKLIDNPNYEVMTGIDVESFYANQPSEAETSAEAFNLIASGAAYILAAVLAVFLFIHVMEST